MGELSVPKSKLKVVLLENIHPGAVAAFREHGFSHVEHYPGAWSQDELLRQMRDVHILGIRSGTKVTDEVLSHSPSLLAVGCFCIGTDQVDSRAAMLNGIPVFNDPHSNTRSVAELVMGLCIMLLRDVFHKNAAAHCGKWEKIAAGAHEVRGRTLGIVGYGSIGSQVAILAEGLGMHVCYYDIEQKLSYGNVQKINTLEALLSMADVVTLHVPETKLTKHLINKERIGLMKKTACLINTSRGSVVDVAALKEALECGALKGAALDVFEKEPENGETPFKHGLQGFDRVILTPHIGGATEEAQAYIGNAVSDKLIRFVDRGSTEGAVNFPALSLAPNQHTHRILHVHKNVPGMLSQINKILSDHGINILAQYLQTSHEIGYVVVDIEKRQVPHLLQKLAEIPNTIRARILY